MARATKKKKAPSKAKVTRAARKPVMRAKAAKAANRKAPRKPVGKAAKSARKAKKTAPQTPQQPVMTHGVFCHIEIPSDDLPASKQFYGKVFGWTFQDMPMGEGEYTIYQTRQGGIGGGITKPPAGAPKQVVNYILVDDLDLILAQVQAKGGKVVTPVTEIPGMGWLSHFTDPQGNLLGLWKANM